MNCEDYFIQYVFCAMDRQILRAENRAIYDALFTKYQSVWEKLNDYQGEDKINLCGNIFKSELTGKNKKTTPPTRKE